MNEIRVTMVNLVKLIKESSNKFIRWRPGTSLCYQAELDNFEPEELPNYSYLRDLYDNQTIKLISVELSELQKQSFQRLNKYKLIWEESKGEFDDKFLNFKNIIWNQKNKFKIDKILEKNSTLENFEFFLEYFSRYQKQFEEIQPEMNAGFIRIDFTSVKYAYINQCKE